MVRLWCTLRTMARITINGQTFVVEGKGNSIHVNGDTIRIDGKVVADGLSGIVEVKWEGPIANLEVHGNVTCGDVGGDVQAGNNVSCGDVAGGVAAGNNVTCGDVGGNANAGNNVTCRR